MIQATSCPSAPVLQRLLLGQSAEEESVSLEEHLLHCEKCLRTVQTLSPDDALISALQQGCESATPAPSSELLDKVRRQLREMPPPSAGMDQPIPGDTLGAAPSPTDATEDVSVPLAPAQLPDEIGRLGGYRILKELGRGGMGVVYQAEDPKLKRLVALKAMLPRLAADPASHQRFLREAQAMAAVHHDHIVTVFQVDEDKGVPFLAMEFLQGMPLDRWLKEGRKATVAQVLRIGREIAEGLAAAHERGLIHRDIKPGNIWLDSDHKGRVKILDFGLARVGTDDVHLTRSGAVVGTPAYMSPEQARGEKVDGRCDLFSLGCVLYKLCTGVMPFAGDTTMGLLMSLALDHPKTVRELNPDAPAALSDLVMRLLAKKPEERPASAREVILAIQAISHAPEDRAAESISAVGANPIRTSLASRTETVAVLPSLAPASGGKKQRPWALAAVAAGFLATAIIVAIVIIILDKDGNEVAKINVQPGYHAELVDNEKRDAPVAAPKVALDDAWVKGVAAVFPKQQIEAVVAELKKRNPEFDGQLDYKTKDGVVVELRLAADHVADISPLRALSGLQVLHCGSAGSASPLADLSPLKMMKLTELDFPHTQVSDLSPLKGMPLMGLACSGARVADLSPLQGAPLTTLDVANNRAVSDLTPLHGAPLTTLLIGNTSVEDLSPLKGMALTHLNFSGTLVSDVTPLAGMPLTDLVCGGTGLSDLSWLKPMKLTSLDCDRLHVSDLSPLKDMKLTTLICFGTQVSDLSPLKGMPLTNLYCANTKVSDLSPLKGMPLTALAFTNTPVSDLSPLTGMKLELLNCDRTAVSDLSPLKGMPLRQLDFRATKVSNLSPLKGMPLQYLACDFKLERDAEIVRSLMALGSINGKPPAEFWKEMGTMSFPPLDAAWVQKVGDLSLEKQVEEVAAELKRRNSGFDGKMTPAIDGGVVSGLLLLTDDVADISPVRALLGLRTLQCSANAGKGRLADLSPLKGMELTSLSYQHTLVSDLSPLKGMPLTQLTCGYSPVSDLSPLQGMPLTSLHCGGTKVSDLSPLKGMKLTQLLCFSTPVSDLSPLKGMPLTTLTCQGSPVSDLSPLKGMNLTSLECGNLVSDLSPLKGMKLQYMSCWNAMVSDLSPLKGMPLLGIWIDFKPERDTEFLRSFKTLRTINGNAAAEFWKAVDAKAAEKKP